VPHVVNALGADSLGSPASLDRLFAETEALSYPYWRSTAQALRQAGATQVASGVMGEVLGGHYGTVGSRRERFRHFVATKVGTERTESGLDDAKVLAMISNVPSPGQFWYMSPGFREDNRSEIESAYRSDRQRTLERYQRRGLTQTSHVIEAYVTEHRGVQLIAQQVLASLAELNVSLPLADRALLRSVTAIPMRDRLHNELSRQLVAARAPQLLRIPMAATCVPAGAPILLHEAGRVGRALVDAASHWTFFRTSGRFGRSTPFGWMNFEQVLRPVQSLRNIVDDLRSPLFDKQVLHRHFDEVDAFQKPIKLAHLFMKIAQMDRLFVSRMP
jgi:hypothetical protein